METRARRRPCELTHQNVEITVENTAQRRAAFELASQRGGIHLPGGAGTLDQRPQRRNVHAENQRRADHAFVAHEPHFELRVTVDRCDQRDEAIDWKEHMPYRTPSLDQRVALDEMDGVAVCEQTPPIGRGQTSQQQILRKRAFAPRHVELRTMARGSGIKPDKVQRPRLYGTARSLTAERTRVERGSRERFLEPPSD